jgi:hypothetical protein
MPRRRPCMGSFPSPSTGIAAVAAEPLLERSLPLSWRRCAQPVSARAWTAPARRPPFRIEVRAGWPQPSSMHSVLPRPQSAPAARHRNVTTPPALHNNTAVDTPTSALHSTTPSAAARHCNGTAPPALQHDTIYSSTTPHGAPPPALQHGAAAVQHLQHCSTTLLLYNTSSTAARHHL